MFTKIKPGGKRQPPDRPASPARGRGRPPGPPGRRGQAAALRIAVSAWRHGYEMTTLRDIAKDAGVSVGLLYRYFPSKRAVIFALYDELAPNTSPPAEPCPRESGATAASSPSPPVSRCSRRIAPRCAG